MVIALPSASYPGIKRTLPAPIPPQQSQQVYLKPLGEEVLFKEPHQAGDGDHPFPVDDPVERIHVLLVGVNDQLPETHPWNRDPVPKAKPQKHKEHRLHQPVSAFGLLLTVSWELLTWLFLKVYFLSSPEITHI